MTLRVKILGHIIKKVGWRIRHSQVILKVKGWQNREWEDSKNKKNIASSYDGYTLVEIHDYPFLEETKHIKEERLSKLLTNSDY